MREQKWRWPWQKPEPPVAPRPPKVGGTRAPSQIQEIDFSQPHDFHFRISYYQHEEEMIFENCLLVGYTTPMSDDANWSEGEETTHNRWIVLQKSDGRRVYIPRNNLVFIEDSAHGGGSQNA